MAPSFDRPDGASGHPEHGDGQPQGDGGPEPGTPGQEAAAREDLAIRGAAAGGALGGTAGYTGGAATGTGGAVGMRQVQAERFDEETSDETTEAGASQEANRAQTDS